VLGNFYAAGTSVFQQQADSKTVWQKIAGRQQKKSLSAWGKMIRDF
jgi:hypothetical protein